MRADPKLQAGTLTLVLTDIEGSSQLWERAEREMKVAVSRHDQLIRQAVDKHGGIKPLEQGEGDSTLTAFLKPSQALEFALDLQRGFCGEPWPEGTPLRIRAALHTGEIDLRDERRYWGPAINRCARLRGIAHGGQTLVSRITRDLVHDRLPTRVSLRDMGVHHLRDLSTPEQVYQLCHPDLETDFLPLLSLEAFPNNLPLQLKSFVPREEEIEEIRRRLVSNRLVTITGAGGSGKTRLAIQVAADSFERFPGGVWLADLAPITEPELVPEAVAKAVKLPSLGGLATALAGDTRGTLDRLIDFLSLRTTLVVLDNCEHLLEASTELADSLLQRCPELALLVTSREPLGLDGESIWRVPSMSVPSETSAAEPSRLLQFQAARLFVERAFAARPDFELTPENGPAIAEIVRRFDGIPLAIELAAARVNVLSPGQIASMLGDTFRLLVGGSRKALERQQTMRASIEWSHAHLSDKEKLLFRRLSVFTAGAELGAVEQICHDDDVRPEEVLDLLSHLVQKSLLEMSERGGRARYSYLEMIRQYARELLSLAGESESIRTRHRDFYLGLVEEAAEGFFTGDEAPWLDALDRDYDNIRAAFEWSVDNGEKESALRIASNLAVGYWWERVMYDEGFLWMDRAMSIEGEVHPEVAGRALLGQAYIWSFLGWSFEERREIARRSVESFDRHSLEPNPWRTDAVWVQALSTALPDNWGLYERAIGEAYRLGEMGDGGSLALGIQIEGFVAQARRDYAGALDKYEQAFEVRKRHHSMFHGTEMLRIFLIPTAMNLAKDYELARRYAVEVLSYWQERKVDLRIGDALNLLGYVSLRQGRLEEARTEIAEGLAIMERVGDARFIGDVTHSLGEVEELSGNKEEARRLFDQALELGRGARDVSLISEALWGLARLSEDPSETVSKLAEALKSQTLRATKRESNPDIHRMAPWVRRLAQAMVYSGQLEDAVRVFAGHRVFSQKLTQGVVLPDELDDYEKAVAVARETLGEQTFEELWEEGSRLEFEQVVDLALGKATRPADDTEAGLKD